ncbi:tumor necrosis factor receptor superfamily member 14-like isoform X1 [Channa argus]|uniref:tumor necrosis factor receptor superfamily member 14-like isoform X1 n=1 Tax=Channa argus TaxID=215402 RepID=UPI003521D264
MFPTFVFVSGLVALTVPALCCREKEYSTRDGQCCPMCQEGTVVRRDCTQLSGTLCVPCEDGTFMNKLNGLTRCFPCAACDTAQGLFEQQKCTLTTDAVCDVFSGYFCRSLSDDGTGCSLAVRHKVCAPGQRIEAPGTSRSDTVCEDCPPGYFSEDGVNCKAWTVCSKTQKKVLLIY